MWYPNAYANLLYAPQTSIHPSFRTPRTHIQTLVSITQSTSPNMFYAAQAQIQTCIVLNLYTYPTMCFWCPNTYTSKHVSWFANLHLSYLCILMHQPDLLRKMLILTCGELEFLNTPTNFEVLLSSRLPVLPPCCNWDIIALTYCFCVVLQYCCLAAML